jgi:hypothetical protein
MLVMFCSVVLPAWLPVAKQLDGTMSLHHRDQAGPYLDRLRTEDIGTVAAEAYEVVEEDETQ